MPNYYYHGHDREGQARKGERIAASPEALNLTLINEGVFPTDITLINKKGRFKDQCIAFIQGDVIHLEELAIFSKQMELLQESGVPLIVALTQLTKFTRSQRLKTALTGVTERVEKGETLSNAMANYPTAFTPLVINIVKIGENTGKLTLAFGHLYNYLNFEANNIKMTKAAFRYPLFVLVSVFLAIISLNIFVIPTFARVYTNTTINLPWETNFLIGMSNLFVHHGLLLLITLLAIAVFSYRYVKTPQGRYRLDYWLLHIPIFSSLIKHLILIRFTQSLSIMLTAGLSVPQSLSLVSQVISNTVIRKQVDEAQAAIERGAPFNTAISQIELFTPLENQITAVGNKNGELDKAMDYISRFHSDQIGFEIKRLADLIGPILITLIAGLVLIVALGVYLPIWNMVNLEHH